MVTDCFVLYADIVRISMFHRELGFMKKQLIVLMCILLLCCLAGCKKKPSGPVDPKVQERCENYCSSKCAKIFSGDDEFNTSARESCVPSCISSCTSN